jgi:uncharacterized protein (DUF934 family)
MQIIKDRYLINNTWKYIADDQELITGDITVSFKRWQIQKSDCLAHSGRIGIRLNSTDAIETLAQDLTQLALIELEFGFFGDGRLFSQAKLLRQRFNYSGEIRAVGNYLIDQIFYLSKVGINAFQIQQPDQLNLALTALDDFSVSYQS